MGICHNTKHSNIKTIISSNNQKRRNLLSPSKSTDIDSNANHTIDHNRKFERNPKQHRTDKQTAPSLNQVTQCPKTEETTMHSSIKSKINYTRQGTRSISLIEKKNLGIKVFNQEMNLKVSTESLIEENNGLPTEKYKIVKKLGDGTFGTVYLAQNKLTKVNVALKRITKSAFDEEVNYGRASKANEDISFANEINILKKLDHPNIVKIIEFYTTRNAHYIINDFCPYGELYDFLKEKLNENQLAVLIYQIFSGLCYLHENKICHRDIKLENILISGQEKDIETDLVYYWAKIIDFGTATMIEKTHQEKVIVGSSYYIAPEVLKMKYNEKCDTWSVGVILHMLLVGKAPFDGSDNEQIINRIKKGMFNTQNEKFLSASPELQDLIKSLLEVNVNKRLSAKEALQHPWFIKYNAKRLYYNITPSKSKEIINRLVTHRLNSKFQQMVLAFIVHNLPQTDEVKDVLKIFKQFNTNDDGKLTKSELKEGLKTYLKDNQSNDIIDDLFTTLDGANNGYIQFEEFLRACLDKKKLLTNNMLLYAFNFIDRDNSNEITVEKIMECFQGDNSSIDLFQHIFNEVHSDREGGIDYDEFQTKMLEM